MQKTIWLIILLWAVTQTVWSQIEVPEDTDEVIKIDSAMSRINIFLPSRIAKDQAKWKLTLGGEEVNEYKVVKPNFDVPLRLVVVSDLSEKRRKLNWITKNDVYKGFNDVNKTLNLALETPVFSDRDDKKFKMPGDWVLRKTNGFNDSVSLAIQTLEKSSSDHQFLLIVTDRFDELPPDIVETIDSRLPHSSAVVYIVSVQNNLEKGCIGRANINGGKLFTAPDHYLRSVFRRFNELVSNVYTIWFDMPNIEFEKNSDLYKIRIEARSSQGEIIGINQREFLTLPEESKGGF